MTASVELPRLHVITNDAVLARPDFAERAQALLAHCGARIALHLRTRSLSGGALFTLAQTLSELEAAVIVINDRVDVALTSQAAGVQLRRDSLPVPAARALLGETRLIGYSAHAIPEASAAEVAGADFVVAGTIFESGSHADAAPRGPEFLSAVAQAVRVPVLAIGGVSAERVRECRAAGAFGVAVIGAVWSADDPLEATNHLLSELED